MEPSDILLLMDESNTSNQVGNETFNISQDECSSDYSHLDRRTSSGSSLHGDQTFVRFNSKPLLKDVKDADEREELFKSKIEQCWKLYDFSDPMSQYDEKEAKSCTLMEFEEILIDEPELIMDFDCFYEEIFKLISKHIFRVLPPPQSHPLPEYDPEDDDPPLEPSWQHLSLVYNLFARLLDLPQFDNKKAKKYVDTKFYTDIVYLFASEDPRERDYLKTILHRIYGKYISSRTQIRAQISNFLLDYMYDNNNHIGVAELLEIMGSVIYGFVSPLKEEHKKFLLNILLPLHKYKGLATYHGQLTYCVVQYIDKDAELAVPIIKYLLQHWPRLTSTREVMFISEMEELVDVTDDREFRKIMVQLFKQFAACITSDQFQVAERCLYMWNNEYFTTLFSRNSQVLMPILFPALNRDPCLHWNRTINGLIYNALKMFAELNPMLLHELDKKHQEEQAAKQKLLHNNNTQQQKQPATQKLSLEKENQKPAEEMPKQLSSDSQKQQQQPPPAQEATNLDVLAAY